MGPGVSLFTQFWENYGRTVCVPDSSPPFPPAKSAEIFIKILTPRCRSFLHWTNDAGPGEVLQYFPPSPSLALPYIWFYIFMHIWFILWLRYNMQGSVPVVSHKFKSGLSVSKEMGLSAVSPCIAPISNSKVEHKPVHIRVKCKFLFPPELQLLHHSNCLQGWMRPLVRVNRLL